ncbi:MAG: TspO and MBR like protein [Candidatus Falkowbacteria bacterium GW2011_GWA2_39_24]|uniref:TspO and MBR like protein n=1 Tax=Candidatus Falkowbacteria bacterium GW2011_GWA2_39_24 TaxID=1618634 RepID=A0A0G0NPI7_9BACT|nr:MAG: TspO and MBR like protein [Candidatus Falkowbacteria bacterium GW2011_GWA2_39_24]
MREGKIKIALLLMASLLFAQLAGWFGAIFNVVSLDDWYPTLVKPSFNPPGWLFGPVWTILFLLMGYALFLILKGQWHKRQRNLAMLVFIIQWLLNIGWSFIFFGLQNPLLAFLEIIILWLTIMWNILVFYRLNKTAAYLLLPYLLWVTFALVLNANIVVLNY